MASLSAADLIDEARDHHVSFDDREFSEKMLLRQLSAAVRHLYREVTRINENALADVVTLTTSDITTALSAGYHTLVTEPLRVLEADAKILNGSTRVPVFVYAAPHRHDPTHFPAIWLAGAGKIRLVTQVEYAGLSSSGWEDFEDLRIWYVPTPTALTTISDTVTLPDFVRDALVSDLVRFMAGRKGGQTLKDLAGILERASDLMRSAIDAIVIQSQSEHGSVVQSVPF